MHLLLSMNSLRAWDNYSVFYKLNRKLLRIYLPGFIVINPLMLFIYSYPIMLNRTCEDMSLSLII